jgi:hypothetical protein
MNAHNVGSGRRLPLSCGVKMETSPLLTPLTTMQRRRRRRRISN